MVAHNIMSLGLARQPQDLVSRQGEPNAKRKYVGVLTAIAFGMMSTGQGMGQPKCDVLKIAEEFVAKKYLLFKASGMKALVSERERQWIVTYELPPSAIGGAPIVTSDKRTCQVVGAHHTQ
jgi:hypothetical protein